MSLFSKIGKIAKKVLPIAASVFTGGAAGAVIGTAGRLITAGSAVTAARRVLPGIGAVAAGGAMGGAVSGLVQRINPATGMPMRRRRGRGFSSRDVRQTKRMLKLIGEVQKCVPARRKC